MLLPTTIELQANLFIDNTPGPPSSTPASAGKGDLEFELSLNRELDISVQRTPPHCDSPNVYSTGNTPSSLVAQREEREEDDYEPAMNMSLAPMEAPLPFKFSSEKIQYDCALGFNHCTSFYNPLDEILPEQLKAATCRLVSPTLKPDEQREWLLYACHRLHNLQYQLSCSRRKDIRDLLESIPELMNWFPLVELPWAAITVETVQRFSPMMLRSAMVQAWYALNLLRMRAAEMKGVLILGEKIEGRGVEYRVYVSELGDGVSARSSAHGVHASETMETRRDSLMFDGKGGKQTLECDVEMMIARERAACLLLC